MNQIPMRVLVILTMLFFSSSLIASSDRQYLKQATPSEKHQEIVQPDTGEVRKLTSNSSRSERLIQDRLNESQKYSQVIQELSTDLYDWSALIEELREKQLILLGEFTHGSREIFESRNSLIRSIHEELGVDLILFEAGIGEIAAIQNSGEHLNPTSGFFGPWQTLEMTDLVVYAKDHHIRIAGFDVQRSGRIFADWASDFLANSDPLIDLESRFGKLLSKLSNSQTRYEAIRAETEQLIEEYARIEELIDLNNSFIHRTLLNRKAYLRYMLKFVRTKDWNERWRSRGEAMASNVEWLIDYFDAERKIIIVGHNFHISRYSENETTMGEILGRRFGNSAYVLGVFSGQGVYLNNSGEIEKLSAPDETRLDIKHVVLGDQAFVSWLDFTDALIPDGHWLFDPIVVNASFIDLSNANQLVPTQHFDGLLMIDQSSAPARLSR